MLTWEQIFMQPVHVYSQSPELVWTIFVFLLLEG